MTDEQEILLKKYAADRTHELELNKISAWYEFALPQVALVLNGASGTALVSFVGGNLRFISGNAPGLIGLALTFWCAGILSALLAGYWSHETQKGYAQAYRARRLAIEIALLGRPDEILLGHKKGDTVESLGLEATRLRTKAGTDSARIKWFGLGSTLCFVTGLALAACGILKVV